MAVGGSRYFKWSPAHRRNPNAGTDFERGSKIGESLGKAFTGIEGAMKEAKMNQLANQLMTGQDISAQPGAGVTQDLGQLPDGSGAPPPLAGTPQSLGPLPQDPTFTNPATGDIQPLVTPGGDNTDLAQAVAAARLAGPSAGPTVGDTAATTAPPSPPPSTAPSGDFALNPTDYTGGGTSTVGSVTHTGGTAEMDIRKALLAQQLQKAQVAKAAADTADATAETAGTGKYALESAQKRANLAKTLADIAKANAPAKPDKNAPAENIDSEPVKDQAQLVRHVDTQYGKGTYDQLISMVSDNSVDPSEVDSGEVDSAGNPVKKPGTSIPIQVSKDKTIQMPLAEAQTYIRQANLQRLQQGLPALRVPGETLDVGSTPDNPFIAHNNLEIYSRAPGTYVRLPNGKLVTAQGPKRTTR